jgi:YD repeat-containing protein
MVVLGLRKCGGERVIDVLMTLLADEQVAGHAVMALGDLRAVKAIASIERFLGHSKQWVRAEARKALGKIARTEGRGIAQRRRERGCDRVHLRRGSPGDAADLCRRPGGRHDVHGGWPRSLRSARRWARRCGVRPAPTTRSVGWRASRIPTRSDSTSSMMLAGTARRSRRRPRAGDATVTYAYDELNRMAAVARGAEVHQYAYDAAGQLTRLTRPNGTSTDYGYDVRGRAGEPGGPRPGRRGAVAGAVRHRRLRPAHVGAGVGPGLVPDAHVPVRSARAARAGDADRWCPERPAGVDLELRRRGATGWSRTSGEARAWPASTRPTTTTTGCWARPAPALRSRTATTRRGQLLARTDGAGTLDLLVRRGASPGGGDHADHVGGVQLRPGWAAPVADGRRG